ncbi:MAG: putative xanthine dehydrogenase subunit A [Alphaproteobacteria bacterium MarineAlpha11_Bin1]|nr:MAG: putative xanthine dehydrogenase subunit A [Alphaproteobacteria bacterium MarineAlpha11_Bin1]|tara:strand:+ start:7794 stop:8507 length:714 start_codon:yes stop_codon:yes gene_type:complete
MKNNILKQILADQIAKKEVALATDMRSGEQTLVYLGRAEGPDAGDGEILSSSRQAIQDDRSRIFDIAGRKIFVKVFNPPLRMLLVGAVHIAQPLSRMASLAGYDVTVIDPRASFATDDRFPGIQLNGEWPDDALRELDPDRRTAVITLTHDPKLDDPGLEVALKSDAFYIGALGSRKTHAGRVERLISSGFTEASIKRIHAPVGIPIGSISPAEISISILAEVTEILHRKTEPRVPA